MSKEQVEVVVIGSCIYDMIRYLADQVLNDQPNQLRFSYAPRFPKAGESVRGTRFLASHGGKGANQAVQAALLGARSAIVTKVAPTYPCSYIQLKTIRFSWAPTTLATRRWRTSGSTTSTPVRQLHIPVARHMRFGCRSRQPIPGNGERHRDGDGDRHW